MDKKRFIKNGLLASGSILLPASTWAIDDRVSDSSTAVAKLISHRNTSKFLLSELGIRFHETELEIALNQSPVKLPKKYFVSENQNGLATPALLEMTSKQNLIFIPEIYKDSKHNGFIVKVCSDGLCEEIKIFTHENQGYYAFWGKEYLGQPTLYHYNLNTFELMRAHREDEQWINHRVMPLSPQEMSLLYDQQLKNVTEGELCNQFDTTLKYIKTDSMTF